MGGARVEGDLVWQFAQHFDPDFAANLSKQTKD
jgi:hypothetical protein